VGRKLDFLDAGFKYRGGKYIGGECGRMLLCLDAQTVNGEFFRVFVALALRCKICYGEPRREFD